MTPSVAIIVLNWNNAPDTLNCLHSLEQLDYADYRVIVVDNGSTDNSVPAILNQYPHILLLETGKNLGFAEGNNVGIRHALQERSDYICLLNNDTLIDPAALRALVDEAESSPKVGIVGPKVYFFDPPNMIFSAGGFVSWARGVTEFRGMYQTEPKDSIALSTSAEVDFIVGCCMLVKREVINRIGLLDPRYYLNFEDVDWCVRAGRAGYQIHYTPHAVLWHRLSASLGQASPQNSYYMTRNALLFFSSHLSGWCRCLAVGRTFARNLGHVLVWTLRPKYRRSAKRKRDATVLALRDALCGRYGEMGRDVATVCSSARGQRDAESG